MRKFLAFCLLLIIFLLTISASYASSFTSAYLRLNTQSANSALSGTVCAKASSAGAGTESKIAVTFPSTFTINTTAANWTTSTSNLPVGSSAWPGIGAVATSVSSKTVTFASSDLTTTNLYCFNFTGTSSTTGAAGTDKLGTITSLNSSDVTIDQTTYSTAIISSNNINITATVDPQISDLPIDIAVTTAGTTFAQDTTIGFQITYGNSASTSIPLTIQAQWTQGTISGNPSPSVDVLDYVVGSASNAYGGTTPVIDTVNRKITWTISSIPGSTTGQTVTFNLKTTSNYTGTSLVSFDVLARATSGNTTTPDDSVTKNYQYSAAAATPTSAPSTATTTPTLTPAPTTATFAFNDVSIKSISSKNAKIAVSTNNKATFTLSYGTSIGSLLQTIKTLTAQNSSEIELSDLEANTDYYFKIKATDENGKIITSDIFTFKTAALSPIPTIDLEAVIVTSNNNILLSPQIRASSNLKTNFIVIPRQSVFVIQFALDKNIPLKSIQAIVRNKKVLGFSTQDEVSAGSNYVNLIEVSPGVYTGKIATPELAGQYEVYVRLIDFNGNILEQKILDLNVTGKFKVLKKGTADSPVENARVLLYLYNRTTKTYSVISPQILPIENPVYSAPNGRFNLILPIGKYKAEISAIGYKPQTVEFEISQYSADYPVVYLESSFNPLDTITYYYDVLNDAIVSIQNQIKLLANSSRLFDFSTFSGVFLLLILSILSISARTHIGVFYLPYFLIYKLMIIFKKNKDKIIFGKVIDEKTKSSVSKAVVNILSTDGKSTLASLKTNKLGEFYFNNINNLGYKIQIVKEGFKPFEAPAAKGFPVIFKLQLIQLPKKPLIKIMFIYLETFLGMGMETLILLSLLVQIYSIFAFGIIRVLPFIIITILNFVLMFTYLYKPRALDE